MGRSAALPMHAAHKSLHTTRAALLRQVASSHSLRQRVEPCLSTAGIFSMRFTLNVPQPHTWARCKLSQAGWSSRHGSSPRPAWEQGRLPFGKGTEQSYCLLRFTEAGLTVTLTEVQGGLCLTQAACRYDDALHACTSACLERRCRVVMMLAADALPSCSSSPANRDMRDEDLSLHKGAQLHLDRNGAPAPQLRCSTAPMSGLW